MRTYAEQMQTIVTDYIGAGEQWPATTHQIASWAILSGRWAPQRASLVDLCADQLARAMREEYITDPQGRRVRAKHAARVRRHEDQITLWADIRTADRAHMEVAFQQRRQQIVGDCRQLKVDVDSYNENRTPEKPIQMVFDFTQDLAEIEALTWRAGASEPMTTAPPRRPRSVPQATTLKGWRGRPHGAALPSTDHHTGRSTTRRDSADPA